MTQPQAQQVDTETEKRVALARDTLRELKPGAVVSIGFRSNMPSLWLLVKNDRFDLTMMSLDDGRVVANKIALFAEMLARKSHDMTLSLWDEQSR